MKKIMLFALIFILTACSKSDVVSEHVITSVSDDLIIVDGNTLLELDNPTLYEDIRPGDTVNITSNGKYIKEVEPLYLGEYLYLTNYQTLGKVQDMTLISRANSLEKEVIFLMEDEDKLIFQDQTSVYSVEPISPLNVVDLPLGATFNVKYFREADTKDYTILSNVYDLELIDDSKKQMIVNVIYSDGNVLVNNMYDDEIYLVGAGYDELRVGDRLLISYSEIAYGYDLTNIHPTYKGKFINNVVVEKTIIKASEKTSYRVTYLEKTDGVLKVKYNNDTYSLVAENGFEFSDYEFVKGSTLRIYANKDIDKENKLITGVYKVRVEA